MLNEQLLDFVSRSPTPYHAVANIRQMLEAEGFTALTEASAWSLQPGQAYYIIRRDSSIVAFKYGVKPLSETGVRVAGAHTDSPCLKVKPEPDITKEGYWQVGIETYGGVLLAPWFDRDLSLAGKVNFVDSGTQLKSKIIDLKRPVATVPSLAIHLDRTANDKRSINPQTQMSPILWQVAEDKPSLKEYLLQHLKGLGVDAVEVLDFDLSFYDVQQGAVIGLNNEFLACARLDNLFSCYVAIKGLMAADNEATSLVVLNDHEEVGSRSTVGAAGNLLLNTLHRLVPDNAERAQCISRSMMLSVDNAHGVHPNFPQKHDSNHGPLLNKGPVLKFDANQSYATQSSIAAYVRILAKRAGVPLQNYVTRADMRCGSTIGSITATQTGIETLDIGVPTFAMHSIRELAGSADADYLLRLLVAFNNDRTSEVL